jgi:DNA-binding SARP family transcriptional activator
MQVRVLGPLRITSNDGEPIAIRQGKTRQLICVLAVMGRAVPPAELQRLIWPEASMRDMSSALTTTVDRARQQLPADHLVRDDDGYQLVFDRGGFDLCEFRSLVTDARKAREASPAQAADLYQAAVDLWGRQPLLPDLPDTPAMSLLINRMKVELRDALEALVKVQLALGRHAAVALEAPRLLAEDPLNEQLWVAHVLALYRDGRKPDALRAYKDAHTTFVTEVGAEPGPRLQTIRDRIMRNDPGLAWRAAAPIQEEDATSAGVDVGVPSSARIYDYLLGGRNNFPADRRAAEQLKEAIPWVVQHVQCNREFILKAVRVAAQAGIRQFLDLGTGFPISPNVHEVAQETTPHARVVYVDNDPVVAVHNRAWRAPWPNVACIEGDIRKPDHVLDHNDLKALIDPAEPVAVILVSVLHFIQEAGAVVKAFRDWMPPGSMLVIATATSEGLSAEKEAQVSSPYQASSAKLVVRSRREIRDLFDGLELLEPGLVATAKWRNPDGPTFPDQAMLSGVGRK